MWRKSSLAFSPHGRLLSTKGLAPGVVISPKDYLKSWLGSDLGTPASAVHSSWNTVTSAPSVTPVTVTATPTPTPTSTKTQLPAASDYKSNSELVVDTSLKRLSLISLQVDWKNSLSNVIRNISPTGSGRKLSCFLNLKNCPYSQKDILELLNAYKTNGYEIIATNVPNSLHSTLKNNGIHFIMAQTTHEGLTLHPVPNPTSAHTQTQMKISPMNSKEKDTDTSRTNENKLQVGTVRSGQQVYAEDCSLTVMGSVNEGAEIMADGDIYVFGKLRGRVVAGLGSSDAVACRIFVTQFEASLVGIKSVFVIPEDHHREYQLLKGRDVCITLELKHGQGQGYGHTTPPICSIDCDDDDYMMVFRPFL